MNIRLLAATVVLASVGYDYVFYGLPWYAFWFIYLATTFISMFCIRMRGKTKVPKRFFLFDLPKGQGGGLPHRPYEHQSIEDYAYGGSRECHREFLYGKD